MTQETMDNSRGGKLRFSLDLRVLVIVLLIIIAGMLALWRPWSGTNANTRTIEVVGETTMTAKPDEFVFYPAYEFKNSDKAAALAELDKKSDEITAKLKELGVPESGIKTTSGGYGRAAIAMPTPEKDTSTYTLSLAVAVNEGLVQKVQDYLVTTAPTGSVSPQAGFSDAKRKELENEARTKAVKDAKAKADQTAKELGFKVGKVKSVSDGRDFSVSPAEAVGRGRSAEVSPDSQTSLGVHPGENKLPYSVTVVYFIR